MKTFSLALAAVLTALSVPAFAAGLPQRDEILVGVAVAIPLHESTPDSSFGGKAPQIGWIKKGESVKVLETKQYLSIFGIEIWVEVAKQSDPARRGWVFAGMSHEIVKGQSKLVSPHAKQEKSENASAGEEIPKSPAASDDFE